MLCGGGAWRRRAAPETPRHPATECSWLDEGRGASGWGGERGGLTRGAAGGAAGPGPVPSLDGENIVMGRVLEGLGTVAQVAAVPTFTPSERLQALNRVASLIGDDRAAKARRPRPRAPCCEVACSCALRPQLCAPSASMSGKV